MTVVSITVSGYCIEDNAKVVGTWHVAYFYKAMKLLPYVPAKTRLRMSVELTECGGTVYVDRANGVLYRLRRPGFVMEEV